MTSKALSKEQKLERKKQIMDAAWQLFEEKDFEDIKMCQIAQACKLAKGTLFIYFKSKDELFLEMLKEEYCKWLSEFEIWLGAPGSKDSGMLVDFFKESIKGRESMLRLLSILHTVLEKNSNMEAIRDFKIVTIHHLNKISELLAGIFPNYDMAFWRRFLVRIQTILVGTYAVSNPAPIVKRVIDENKLDVFKVEFSAFFIETLTLMLRGIGV